MDGKNGKQKADLAIPASDTSRHPGYTCLHIAAKENRGDAIDLLVRNGANVNAQVVSDNAARGYTPLMFAAGFGNDRQVRRLLEGRADPSILSPDNISPLSIAARSGNFESVKALINKLNIVNIPNDNGITPLINACVANKLDIVRFLLEKGAEVNHQARGGSTALIVAAPKSNLGIIQELLRAGTNVNLRTNTGFSALNASMNPTVTLPIVKTLLDAGAEVDEADEEGVTPLARAVHLRKNDIVLELLRRGADSSRMFRGQTIAAYARTRGLPAEILEALTFSRRHHALRGFAAAAAPAPAAANAAAAPASRRGGRRKCRLTRRRQQQR